MCRSVCVCKRVCVQMIAEASVTSYCCLRIFQFHHIITSSHLHLTTSSHLQMLTSSSLLITRLYILTSSPHTCTSSFFEPSSYISLPCTYLTILLFALGPTFFSLSGQPLSSFEVAAMVTAGTLLQLLDVVWCNAAVVVVVVVEL